MGRDRGVSSVLSEYREPRAHETALLIAARERAMLAKKAEKDAADLRAMLYTDIGDDGPARPERPDKQEKHQRPERPERDERERKKNRHEIAAKKDKEYMRKKRAVDEAGLRSIERELMYYDDDEPVLRAARLVVKKQKEDEREESGRNRKEKGPMGERSNKPEMTLDSEVEPTTTGATHPADSGRKLRLKPMVISSSGSGKEYREHIYTATKEPVQTTPKTKGMQIKGSSNSSNATEEVAVRTNSDRHESSTSGTATDLTMAGLDEKERKQGDLEREREETTRTHESGVREMQEQLQMMQDQLARSNEEKSSILASRQQENDKQRDDLQNRLSTRIKGLELSLSQTTASADAGTMTDSSEDPHTPESNLEQPLKALLYTPTTVTVEIQTDDESNKLDDQLRATVEENSRLQARYEASLVAETQNINKLNGDLELLHNQLQIAGTTHSTEKVELQDQIHRKSRELNEKLQMIETLTANLETEAEKCVRLSEEILSLQTKIARPETEKNDIVLNEDQTRKTIADLQAELDKYKENIAKAEENQGQLLGIVFKKARELREERSKALRRIAAVGAIHKAPSKKSQRRRKHGNKESGRLRSSANSQDQRDKHSYKKARIKFDKKKVLKFNVKRQQAINNVVAQVQAKLPTENRFRAILVLRRILNKTWSRFNKSLPLPEGVDLMETRLGLSVQFLMKTAMFLVFVFGLVSLFYTEVQRNLVHFRCAKTVLAPLANQTTCTSALSQWSALRDVNNHALLLMSSESAKMFENVKGIFMNVSSVDFGIGSYPGIHELLTLRWQEPVKNGQMEQVDSGSQDADDTKTVTDSQQTVAEDATTASQATGSEEKSAAKENEASGNPPRVASQPTTTGGSLQDADFTTVEADTYGANAQGHNATTTVDDVKKVATTGEVAVKKAVEEQIAEKANDAVAPPVVSKAVNTPRQTRYVRSWESSCVDTFKRALFSVISTLKVLHEIQGESSESIVHRGLHNGYELLGLMINAGSNSDVDQKNYLAESFIYGQTDLYKECPEDSCVTGALASLKSVQEYAAIVKDSVSPQENLDAILKRFMTQGEVSEIKYTELKSQFATEITISIAGRSELDSDLKSAIKEIIENAPKEDSLRDLVVTSASSKNTKDVMGAFFNYKFRSIRNKIPDQKQGGNEATVVAFIKTIILNEEEMSTHTKKGWSSTKTSKSCKELTHQIRILEILDRILPVNDDDYTPAVLYMYIAEAATLTMHSMIDVAHRDEMIGNITQKLQTSVDSEWSRGNHNRHLIDAVKSIADGNIDGLKTSLGALGVTFALA